jgi:hypothetical protein
MRRFLSCLALVVILLRGEVTITLGLRAAHLIAEIEKENGRNEWSYETVS